MLELKCQNEKIALDIEGQDRLSMIIAGGSRMGKTFFASLYANYLIEQGCCVHLIDLGSKWSESDKVALIKAGAITMLCAEEEIVLPFSSANELINCGRYLVNALGFKSTNAQAVMKNIIRKIINKRDTFQLSDLLSELENSPSGNEWRVKILERFEMWEKIPEIKFHIDEQKSILTAYVSIIWDLDGLEESQVQVWSNLIMYNLLCAKRRITKQREKAPKLFVIIDEFQNLNCKQESIVGICLTEGQKYELFLILITQFIQSKFSDAVVKQFKQGGYNIYFRLTEGEAAEVSRQMAYDLSERKELYKRLISLPRGCCLLKGYHSVNGRTMISEKLRFVEVQDI